VSCDTWMNINLREVICTSKDGDKFWKMPECYIRGSTIKYLRIPDEVIDLVKEDVMAKSRNRQEVKGNRNQNQRGGGGNRNQNQNNRNFGGNRNQGGGQGQGGQKNQNQRNKK
jgi:U6 snRNA-associated Sm-like protein LSm4